MSGQAGNRTDHRHFRFQTILNRPGMDWPEGAHLAMFVLLHVESFEIAPPEGSHGDPRFRGEFGSYSPDFRGWSAREYGARVGLWRVLDLLDRHGLQASVAIDAQSCERYPAIVEAVRKRGWEPIAHGISISRMITSETGIEEERGTIAASTAAIETAFGERACGWLSPDFGESPRTLQLLAEGGYDYVLDWANDDAPYWLTTSPREMVSIPHPVEWDDLAAFSVRRVPIDRYPDLVESAFNRLLVEGRTGPRIFGLSLHPWFIGAPHRIAYLAKALDRIVEWPDVWWTSAGAIAARFRAAAT